MGLFDNLKRAAAGALNNTVSNAVKSAGSNESTAVNSAVGSSVESKTYTFNALPQSVEEMKALPESQLDTPFKTAALTVCALCVFPDNREESKAMLNFLKGPQSLTPYEEQFIADRFMDGKRYVPFSYFEGTSPENDYTPSVPYTITVSSNPYSFQEENYAVLYLKSSGADSERNVKLRRKGDQWFLWEQFLLPDIRKPKSADPWA